MQAHPLTYNDLVVLSVSGLKGQLSETLELLLPSSLISHHVYGIKLKHSLIFQAMTPYYSCILSIN